MSEHKMNDKSSIFYLKTNTHELSSANQGSSSLMYQQNPPTRDVVGNNFANGAIHFRWEVAGEKWWIPSRSYLRMRAKLTKGDGTTPIVIEDDLAVNMGTMAGLFQSAEMRINDKVVSRVPDFLAQVDALEHRLTKSKSWLDSFGKSTNFWDPSFLSRQNDVSADGTRYTTDTNEDVQSSTELGYASPNQMTLSFNNESNRIEIEKNGVTDLPTGVWKAGDFVEITAGDLRRTRFPVANVVSDTVDSTRLTIEPRDEMPATAGVNFLNFNRVRGNRKNEARKAGEFELTWTPAILSLFKIDHAMPTGRYELVLNPQTSNTFQKRAIQSIIADKVPTLGSTVGDFKFDVVDFYMYTSVVDGPRVDDMTYLLDLNQTRCQSEKIDNTSFGQKNMDVSPSTSALTVAYQDLRSGQDTRVSPSIFKSYDAALNTQADVSEELKLDRLFINFAGVNRPQPDASPFFRSGVDNTVQRYVDSQINSGAMHDTGGTETIQEFHQRGSYYHLAWPRDGADRSTRVSVHQGFQTGADVSNLRLLLFDHSKQVARIRVENSRVVDVQLEDA
jgi:hypothetical protein